MKIEILTGNEAAAYGAKMSRVEVVAAYPITPQTSLVEKIQQLINNGELKAEYINVESEHSAMGACIGASVGGARSFTATSSQGLLLMQEMLFWAGFGRLPVVMAVVTRAVAPPWNMWSEHTDALAQRDSCWIQIFCHTAQEVFDSVVQAYRVAEDKRVRLPVMVCYDGFEISHTAENVIIPEQSEVDGFLPSSPNGLFDSQPKLFGNGMFPDKAAGFREILADTTRDTSKVIEEVNQEFKKTFGRSYDSLEIFGSPHPEIIILAMGALASTAKAAVRTLNEEGIPVALARVRTFRPFPAEKLKEIVTGEVKYIVSLDRAISFHDGILSTEAKAALYGVPNQPRFFELIAGLGGEVVKCSTLVAAIKTLSLSKELRPKKEGQSIWLRNVSV